jgi:2,4-dienoyl-CoA reductase-like NADH-dependent reductase (Old Yellow Enzyme family)
MAGLFDPIDINGMGLSNRMVRSATWEGMCSPDGRPGERLMTCYETLARGGAGLIITGFAFVRPDGRQMPGKMGLHRDDFMKDFMRLTGAVHSAGGRVAVQLVHAGGQTNTRMAGRRPLAPSSIQVKQFPEIPDELDREEIRDIAAAFAGAALRAREWGFDAVQLHSAHGYLINQFLSPLTNRRSDDYGGSLENRCRFLMEVYQGVRAAVGKDFPVMIKLNGSDNLEGGLTQDDALHAAGELSRAGVDAIEVSAGTSASERGRGPVRKWIDAPVKEGYNMPLAWRIKEAVACPVIAVGGFRSWGVARDAVEDGGVDLIAMSRPLIREPGLPLRWRKGDLARALCVSCNKCFGPGVREGGIYCVAEAEEGGGP